MDNEFQVQNNEVVRPCHRIHAEGVIKSEHFEAAPHYEAPPNGKGKMITIDPHEPY